jgi:hypothetical protein
MMFIKHSRFLLKSSTISQNPQILVQNHVSLKLIADPQGNSKRFKLIHQKSQLKNRVILFFVQNLVSEKKTYKISHCIR